jgi:hypothetical protein
MRKTRCVFIMTLIFMVEPDVTQVCTPKTAYFPPGNVVNDEGGEGQPGEVSPGQNFNDE